MPYLKTLLLIEYNKISRKIYFFKYISLNIQNIILTIYKDVYSIPKKIPRLVCF